MSLAKYLGDIFWRIFLEYTVQGLLDHRGHQGLREVDQLYFMYWQSLYLFFIPQIFYTAPEYTFLSYPVKVMYSTQIMPYKKYWV